MNPFFKRGGNFNNSSNAGVFYFNNDNGGSNNNNGFRVVALRYQFKYEKYFIPEGQIFKEIAESFLLRLLGYCKMRKIFKRK